MNPKYDCDEINPTVTLDAQNSTMTPREVVLAHFSGLNNSGQALIKYNEYSNENKTVLAQTTIRLNPSDSGRQVVVMFINGDASLPIITGLVRSPLYDMIEASTHSSDLAEPAFESPTDNILDQNQELTVDGKKVRIEASEEIVLKCGASSITLTKSGKILIRGKYLLNRSSGINRIMGGSVQVN